MRTATHRGAVVPRGRVPAGHRHLILELVFQNRPPKKGSFKKKGPSSLLDHDINPSEEAEHTRSGIRDRNSRSLLLGGVI